MRSWKGWRVLCGVVSLSIVLASAEESNSVDDFVAITVATEETEGFVRFRRSAQVYNVPLTVLGKGEKWTGGDMHYAGGGQKIGLLKTEMRKYRHDKHKIVLFVDSYDVIFLSTPQQITEQFLKSGARILFSAEGNIWPDKSLVSSYPEVLQGKRFLNSGAFMGYAPEVYQLLSAWQGSDQDDDQLFYTRQFLNEDTRAALKIKLDHKSQIFQNLFGAVGDIELEFSEEEGAVIVNKAYKTKPLIVHGNGLSKQALNTLGNYLAKSWSPNTGCTTCDSDLKPVPDSEGKWPTVVVALFVEQATPFLEEFLDKILALEYPKSSLHLFIHNKAEYHKKQLLEFVDKHGSKYISVESLVQDDNLAEETARNKAITYCVAKECDYLFVVDSIAHLDNKDALRILMTQNKLVIAPLLTRPFKAWSNFWGALNADGYYARSADYLEIVQPIRLLGR